MEYGITPVFYKNYQAMKVKKADGKRKYKYIINTGSSRSSKTWSLMELLHRICENNKDFRVTAWRDTQTDARKTIWRDFQKMLSISGRIDYKNRNKTEAAYSYPEQNSTFEIHGADDEEKVHGLTQNVAWLNEPYKISKDTFDQIDQRSDLIFIDWNPKKSHWIEQISKQDNAIVIHSTYKDNPFCPEQQRIKIESYEPTEYNISQGTANNFKWQIYGLGLKAEAEGRIYKWNSINLQDYYAIQKEVYYGCDWGAVDPFAVVEGKYHDGNLYVRELNYASENEIRAKLSETEKRQIEGHEDNEGLIPYIFTKIGVSKRKTITCDSNRPNKILALRRAGWEYAVAIGGKSKLLDRIDTLRGINIYYTNDSTNIEYEQENYCYSKDKFGVQQEEPIDQDNHCFEGETLITTINGNVPIKSIEAGDLVLTRKGYKRVIKKFDNGVKKVNVYSMLFDTFSLYLTCTEDHLIKTLSEWKPIKDLNNNLKEKLTIYMPEKDILVKEQTDCIESFGNIITEKYQKDLIFTTKMKTQRTTRLRTLSYCQKQYIYQNTVKKGLRSILNGLNLSTQKVLKRQKNGISRKMVKSGTRSKLLNQALVVSISEKGNVSNVRNNTTPKEKIKYSAQINVPLSTDETLVLTTKKENALYVKQNLQLTDFKKHELVAVNVLGAYNTQVYDLMVEDEHEYFANGILVHNCIDAIAYMVQKLFDLGVINNI